MELRIDLTRPTHHGQRSTLLFSQPLLNTLLHIGTLNHLKLLLDDGRAQISQCPLLLPNAKAFLDSMLQLQFCLQNEANSGFKKIHFLA